MSRDRGSILFSLWGDDDWRELSTDAQHLYMRMLTSPALTYAGTMPFDAGKESGFTRTATADDRYDAALELAGAYFIVMDEETGEVLVRSFLRHDGLLKKPNVAIAMTKAFAEVGSTTLRGVIVHELRRLKVEFPDWPAWSHPACAEHVSRVLKGRSLDPKKLLPLNGSPNPSGNGSVQGSEVDGSRDPSLPLPLQLPLPTPKGVAATPSPFCIRHPEGTDEPCRACGVARKAFEKAVTPPTASGIITDPDCPKHPHRPARGCDRCAEEAS